MSDENVRTMQRIIIDLGSQKRKAIRELKQGSGQIIQEIHEVAQPVAAGQETEGKQVVRVAIIFRKRARKRSRKRRGLLGEILRRL